MKRIFVVGIFLTCLLAYSNKALDKESNQGVIISPQDAAISSIIEKIDEAQTSGDVALFGKLLSEYKTLNPAKTVEEETEVFLGPTETKSRWIGDDIEIDSAYDFQGFSMDTRNDSTIYLAISKMPTSTYNYRIYLLYSNDGISWGGVISIGSSTNDLINPSLKIVETPDTDYVFIAFERRETSSPYDSDIAVYRRNLVSGTSNLFYPANSSLIQERNPSLDADDVVYPTSPFLHLAFESGDSIAYMRSVDRGATWVDRAIIGVAGASYYYYDPSLAYGPSTTTADSMNLGVAWTYYSSSLGLQRIRFRKNIYKGASGSWGNIVSFTSPANCFDDRPSLKMTHGIMNSATIVYARRDTAANREDPRNLYTYDAGRTWWSSVLDYGGTNEVLNTLAMDDSPNNYHVFFKGYYDDIRYREAHYDDFSSSGWTFSIGISDTSSAGGDVSNITPPASAVRGDEPCVCWKTYVSGSWRLMFDALWLQAGIGEPDENVASFLGASPAVFSSRTDIEYYIPNGQNNNTLDIYNIAGSHVIRLAKGIKAGKHSATWFGDNEEGNPVPSGLYFCVLETNGNKVSTKITLLR
jgi:hypothetical protein